MNTSIRLFLVCSLACGVCAGGTWARKAAAEDRFRGKALSAWARILTADRTRHTDTLFEIGPRIVPYLVNEIERCTPDRRDFPRELYSFAFYLAPRTIQDFMASPITPEERRLNAVILLGKLEGQARQGVPALIGLLDDEELAATGAVVETLGNIGADAQAAIPKLIEMLDNPLAEVVTTLGKIGPGARAAIPVLRNLSTNGPLVLQRAAKKALTRIEINPNSEGRNPK